jgi:hypothetical protein
MITGVLALAPERGAVETLEEVLALPDLSADMIVIQGASGDVRGRRAIYRELFAALGRARRTVLWIPGPVDRQYEREVLDSYRAMTAPRLTRRSGALLLAAHARPLGLTPAEAEIVAELSHSFNPRLAARIDRPAVYLLRDHGGRQWIEL